MPFFETTGPPVHLSGRLGSGATNNLAERQLRPAVIARKVSCGNKTPQGAHTWEILASLAATCVQRCESFAQLVSQATLLSQAR
ncbi:MAG: hypothetical protein JWQ71_4553 [Pedosphaera sp.]|nr:hypothetical protein [Pedosphaera sp.]